MSKGIATHRVFIIAKELIKLLIDITNDLYKIRY